MLGRNRYKKLLKALLQDFKFIEGHIFSGENFNSVASKKAITFTIWKYCPKINTNIESLTFFYNDKELKVKRIPLLKDGWKYDSRTYIKGEIVVQGNDRFNASPPKIFHLEHKKGGSELTVENVKKDLGIPNIPSELIYGLWSVCVGYLSITDFPISFNEAYTHLPDFSKPETLEILAYVIIHTIITELKNNYCQGKIGFIGINRIFKFGDNPALTKGCEYLINTYGNCPIGNKTIKEVFTELKNEPDINKIDQNYRRLIKYEIEKRLECIGYWNILPIPLDF